MSLPKKKQKRTKKRKQAKSEEPEYMKHIRAAQARNFKPKTKIPAKKVSREKVMELIKVANKGARSLQSFELDPASVKIFPHPKEPSKRILRAKVKKAWESGVWRGGRMTSTESPISTLPIQHVRTEMTPYYVDIARDAGLRLKHEDYTSIIEKKNGALYVEFNFDGIEVFD